MYLFLTILAILGYVAVCLDWGRILRWRQYRREAEIKARWEREERYELRKTSASRIILPPVVQVAHDSGRASADSRRCRYAAGTASLLRYGP